ncbi:MAG: GNAT family protein [Flavobacteriaceae bacterium]|jgi:diamine N-acetyltransferase|tara:strand:- start:8948 stop:9484 length:537 start_codon:yes stop_codon:yes gene_type:complete
MAMTLTGAHLTLRALEPEDLDFLYAVENNQDIWSVSDTVTPYSKAVLKDYLANAHRPIYETLQLRMVICLKQTQQPIGLVDLFDFDPKHRKAGVGIVISENTERQKGRAKEAIELLLNYGFRHLKLHQVYALVAVHNVPSIKLFEGLGFSCSGVLKSWWLTSDGYTDLNVFQRVRSEK